VYVTGFDLGGAEAEAQAQALQSAITGGATFGAPGLPGYSLTAVEGDLVDYVDYGDPIGNWASDPGGELTELAPADMNHYGRVTMIGDPDAAAVERMAVNTFELSGTMQLRKLLTKYVAKTSKVDKTLRIKAIKAVRALAVYDSVMSNAKYVLFAGGAVEFHTVAQYAADLGITVTPVVAPPSDPAVYLDLIDSSADQKELDEDEDTSVAADGAITAPDYTTTVDQSTGELTGLDYKLSQSASSPYDVAFDSQEQIATLSANDPSGQSYEFSYDNSGTEAWSTSTEYYSGLNESGAVTAIVDNWRSGGSQAQLFVDLPAGDHVEFLNYSDPDATGKLISTSFE
jgi:hypothetical protein